MQKGKCPKCGGSRVGHFENVLDSTSQNSVDTRIRNREFKILGEVKEKTGMFSSEVHRAEIEAYVCTSCGYLEEYVKDPGSVPWESLALFRWASD